MSHSTTDRPARDVPPSAGRGGSPHIARSSGGNPVAPAPDAARGSLSRLGYASLSSYGPGDTPTHTRTRPGPSAPPSAPTHGRSTTRPPRLPHTPGSGYVSTRPDGRRQRPVAESPDRDRAWENRPSFRSAATPDDAFDELYAYAAPGLVHQIRLLTGRRGFAFEAVEHAFHHAWEHWPEVAVDPDPVGWVRAQAYEYAQSPWHRFRPALRHAEPEPADPLLQALLALPATCRRIALLCDGLGLTVSQAAAETETSTAVTRDRLVRARVAIGQHVPELDHDIEALKQTLRTLVTEGASATLPSARSTRAGSDRRMRVLTRVVCALTAGFIAVVTFVAASTPTRNEEPHDPGGTVTSTSRHI